MKNIRSGVFKLKIILLLGIFSGYAFGAGNAEVKFIKTINGVLKIDEEEEIDDLTGNDTLYYTLTFNTLKRSLPFKYYCGSRVDGSRHCKALLDQLSANENLALNLFEELVPWTSGGGNYKCLRYFVTHSNINLTSSWQCPSF
jgi:hypothetical protein